MIGECNKCGEHCLDCKCKIYNDDHLVAKIVTDCLHVMNGYDTITKMTACYNLTERVLRLFAIQGAKEDVNNLIDEFHNEIKKNIEEYL